MSVKTFFAKKYQDLDGFVQKLISEGVDPGMFCTEVDEPVPSFRRAECEKVISTSNNSYIVLGRDRNESLASGCGGQGWTGAGMIDMVVGRAAVYSAGEKQPLGPENLIGPSFATDAARIYITQKSLGIDDYFGFTSRKVDSYGKSAIALKADHTRVIARESVRIYAGPGAFTGKKETNCNGVSLEHPRIDLIAGNEGKLQPAILGNNLVEHLSRTYDIIRDLIVAVKDIYQQLMSINGALSVVTMGAPPFTNQLISSMSGFMDQIIKTLNTHLEEANALEKLLIPGHRSILSNSVYIT
jgi:hypothetical protein